MPTQIVANILFLNLCCINLYMTTQLPTVNAVVYTALPISSLLLICVTPLHRPMQKYIQIYQSLTSFLFVVHCYTGQCSRTYSSTTNLLPPSYLCYTVTPFNAMVHTALPISSLLLICVTLLHRLMQWYIQLYQSPPSFLFNICETLLQYTGQCSRTYTSINLLPPSYLC
jgi:hypothetical protein